MFFGRTNCSFGFEFLGQGFSALGDYVLHLAGLQTAIVESRREGNPSAYVVKVG